MTDRFRLIFAAAIACLWASSASAEASEAEALAVSAPVTGVKAPVASSEGAQPADSAPPPAAASGWEFSAAPNLWLAGLKGDVGIVSQVEPVGVDLSFGDILGALKFGAMGSFEARNGRFVASADVIYMSLGTSDNIEIREVDFLNAELDVKTFISTLTAGYRAVDQDRLFMDVFAGGRIISMKTSLDLQGPRRSFSGSKSETWVDPVIGARFQAPLGPDWSVTTYGDVGGFGVGSHLTWQLLGLVQYDLSRSWTLTAGWRHLDIDYENNGFVFDAAMDGPIIGVVYRF